MKHSRGWRPDDGRRPRKMFRALAPLGGTPRGSADLRPSAPAVMNQGPIGACVGCGLSCGAATTLAAQGNPLGFTPSQRRIYTPARCLDRADDNPFTDAKDLPLLEDVGTFVLTGVEVLSKWGVKATDAPMVGPDGTLVNSDCVPANVNDESVLIDLEEQSTKLVIGAYQIMSYGSARINEVCLALDAGYAVVFGTFVDSTFDDYGQSSPLVGAQNTYDSDGGGHCMAMLGYRTEPDGKRVFIGRNSWGTGWGQNGDFECTEEFVRQWSEAFVMRIQVSA